VGRGVKSPLTPRFMPGAGQGVGEKGRETLLEPLFLQSVSVGLFQGEGVAGSQTRRSRSPDQVLQVASCQGNWFY